MSTLQRNELAMSVRMRNCLNLGGLVAAAFLSGLKFRGSKQGATAASALSDAFASGARQRKSPAYQPAQSVHAGIPVCRFHFERLRLAVVVTRPSSPTPHWRPVNMPSEAGAKNRAAASALGMTGALASLK